MAILNQTAQSQLSNKNKNAGVATSKANSTNYDNTLIITAGKGEVISQVDPLNQSNLAPAPNAAADQSYIKKAYDQNLR
jgi:hypothetical protein